MTGGYSPLAKKEKIIMTHCLSIDENTGQLITGWAVVQQSIERIFRTQSGSRILQRHFGSRLPQFIDQPYAETWLGYIYAAMAEALVRFEPRFLLERIQLIDISKPKDGLLWIKLTGVFLPNGAADDLDIRFLNAEQIDEKIGIQLS